MDLAPNDPDGNYARRFVRAWANSFGRPNPVNAKLVHNAYLRSAASLSEIELEQALRRRSSRSPEDLQRWSDQLDRMRARVNPPGQLLQSPPPTGHVVLPAIDYVGRPLQRPWYRRLADWLCACVEALND